MHTARPEEHVERIAAQIDIPDATDEDTAALEEIQTFLADVRRAGFAHTAAEYRPAYDAVFRRLDAWEAALAQRRHLRGGPQPTLADWWLFAALVRFDPVFYGLYKCNRNRVIDMPAVGGFLRDLFQRPGVADTVDFDAIRKDYWLEDLRIHPKGVVPLGGVGDLWAPHDRARRFAREEHEASAVEEEQGTVRAKGEFVRGRSAHRDRITADGSSGFAGVPGRYHLYVANNCPWCHRVALARSLKGLQDVVSMDVLFYRRDPERGWQFRPDEDGCTPDSLFGSRYVQEIYARVDSKERSVPILYDRERDVIVNNESAEIIRMLDDGFGEHARADLVLYPEPLRAEIDELNAWIYTDINNGAYKGGFASSQGAYESAYHRFFAALERLDRRLRDRRFLTGDALTEADVRLFPTIFRFDHVYYTRFRLNARMVREYVDLHRWLRDVYHQPGVAEASNLEHCKRGYFGRTGNNIVPAGPALDFEPAP